MDALDQFLINLAEQVLNPLILLMFAAAVIYFLWGVLKYIQNSQSDSERQKGSQHILWGLVGIVIMMGVYTILRIALSTILRS